MTIPAFTDKGLLPPGAHRCKLSELQAVFGSGARRERLVENLKQCLSMMRTDGLRGTVYVDGSFCTDKPEPGDIDLVLDVRAQKRQIQEAALLFRFNRHRELHNLEMHWFANFPHENDFASFFQYAGDKTAVMKQCDVKHPKGILRLSAW